METLINAFPTLPIEQQLVLVFWSVCVVMFYSSITFIVGDVIYKTIKKVF
jgi:hypothetical protein